MKKPSETKTHFWELFKRINHSLRLNPHLKVHLSFQAFYDYNCSLCGNCCVNPDGVLIDQDFYDKWNQTIKHHPSGKFQNAVVKFNQPTSKKYGRIKNQDHSKRCSFLTEENTCFIHSNYGSHHQPVVCQHYPKREFVSHGICTTSHLTATCVSVPELWFKEPELIYNLIENHDNFQNLIPTAPESITPFAYHLWLGVFYDSLIQNHSIASNLKRLIPFFYTLYQKPQMIDENSIENAYRSFLSHEGTAQDSEFSTKGLSWLLKHFLQPFFPSIAEYFNQYLNSPHLLNRLKTPKNKIIDSALKHYLFHYSLGRKMNRHQNYHLLKEFIFMITSWQIIQLLMIYANHCQNKSIDLKLMAYITNQTTRVISLSQILNIQYSDEELLTFMTYLLALNLTNE